MRLPRAIFAALFFLLPTVVRTLAADPAPASSPAAEPQLHRGTLPNGFRYAVLPHPSAAGGVGLRLIVHAGSLDERDDERGYAHFVEHMAFNGTKHFPVGRLIAFFQRLGIANGADLNADTSFTHTSYRIDLPAAHRAQLTEALQVMRDFADGVQFDPAEVAREKKVVLSELTARNTDGWRSAHQRLAWLYADTGAPARMPAGEPKHVAAVTAAGLETYYRRCYRPERMTLVLAGDLTTAEAERLIAAAFGSLVGVGPVVPPVEPGQLRPGALRTHVILSETVTAAVVTVSTADPLGPSTLANRERMFTRDVLARLLSRRLAERQQQDRARIGRAGVEQPSDLDDRFRLLQLVAHAKFTDWRHAVALLESELRGARERGFEPAEVQEAVTAEVASRRDIGSWFARQPPAAAAAFVASRLVAGRDWVPLSEVAAESRAFAAQATPASILNLLRTSFAEDQLSVLLWTRSAPEGGAEAVRAEWQRSASLPLAPARGGLMELKFNYNESGPPGQIVQRRRESDLQLDLVQFANGVRVNLRSSPVEPGHFRLTARLGRGVFDIPANRPGLPMLAARFLTVVDFGRNTRTEANRLMDLHGIGGNFSCEVPTGELSVSFSGRSSELPFVLRFLTAFLSDVKLDEARLQDAYDLYGATQVGIFRSASQLAMARLWFRLGARDPRLRFPPLSEVKAYPYSDLAAWIREHVLAGPLEIGIAGDVDVAATIQAAAASVGTLPLRRASAAPEQPLRFLQEPYQGVAREVLAQQAAVIRFAWPAPDAANTRVFRALQVGTAVLVDRLHRTLREDRGETYSPTGSVARHANQHSFTFAGITVTASPENARDLARRVFRIADDLAWRGMTADEFERAREPFRASAAQQLTNNGWWLSEVLTHAQSQPSVLADARTLVSTFNDLTREEVNRVIARTLHPDNATYCGVIPAVARPAGR